MTDVNNEVLGEETLSTATMEVKEIPLVKVGKYPATLKGMSIHVGKEWNSVPNISLQHKLDGDGKGRVIFSNLLLGMHPDRNGQFNYQRKNGLKAFMVALGTDIEGLKVLRKQVTNPETNETVELKFIDAKQIVDALKQFVGTAYQVRVSISKGSQGFSDKNDVFEFFPAEG